VDKKLEKLTPEQEKRMVEFREQWLRDGLSTEPADFKTAKSVITSFYKQLKKPAPTFHCLPSPKACAEKMQSLHGGDINTYLNSSFFGQQEAYWVAYYKFAEEIGVQYGKENSKLLEQWAKLARSINWWTPYENDCFISDRPSVVKFDNDNRLHREDGPAVEYRDGWGICMWHGTRVPAAWIMDKKNLTAKIALTWQNIEQRRAACEILGWVNILTELKAKTINKDADPEIGELLEVNIPDIGKERFLKVQCGTGRTFALPVPPTMKTALQANAWTFGIDDVKQFMKPEIRT